MVEPDAPPPVGAPENGDPKPEPVESVQRPQADIATTPGPKPTDPKTFFKSTTAMDRLKSYLKDVPVLHARLVKVVEQQEANLVHSEAHVAASKKALQDFDSVTAKISETADRWEKDEAKKKKKPSKKKDATTK